MIYFVIHNSVTLDCMHSLEEARKFAAEVSARSSFPAIVRAVICRA